MTCFSHCFSKSTKKTCTSELAATHSLVSRFNCCLWFLNHHLFQFWLLLVHRSGLLKSWRLQCFLEKNVQSWKNKISKVKEWWKKQKAKKRLSLGKKKSTISLFSSFMRRLVTLGFLLLSKITRTELRQRCFVYSSAYIELSSGFLQRDEENVFSFFGNMGLFEDKKTNLFFAEM